MTRVLPLLFLVALAGGPAEFREEFRGAAAAERIRLLEALPGRMADWEKADRRALAPFLIGLLREPEAAPLHAVAIAPLVETGTEAGVRMLLPLLLSREPTPLRAIARDALVRRGGAEVTGHVERFLRRDASARARARLALVLGDRADRSAAGTLVAALEDSSPIVRAAAAEALTRITGVCRGYEPAAWDPLPEVPEPAPPPEEGEAGAPGEVVTSPSPSGEGTREAPVGELVPEFYGIPLDRALVVVVLDFSGSVSGPGADVVRTKLGRALCLLPTTRRFTVLAFDERLLTFGSEPARAGPDEKDELLRFLDDLPPGRRTELMLPIRSGLALAAKSGDAQVLLLSDGAPTVASGAFDELLETADGLAGKGVRVDAAVYGGRPVALFRYLVRATGGRYASLPSAR